MWAGSRVYGIRTVWTIYYNWMSCVCSTDSRRRPSGAEGILNQIRFYWHTSYSTSVFIKSNRNCTVIFVQRIFKQNFMLFHVNHFCCVLNALAVLTFSACTPPLSEVLLLWDFLLAYGIHMNILAIISQLIILRDDILQHQSFDPFWRSWPFRPMKLLRKLPPLNSRKVIALSVSFLRRIPQDVYALLASHAWDDSVGGRIDQLHANLEWCAPADGPRSYGDIDMELSFKYFVDLRCRWHVNLASCIQHSGMYITNGAGWPQYSIWHWVYGISQLEKLP